MTEQKEKEESLNNKNNKIKEKLFYVIQEQEKIIKFYLINNDIYYIFIKNKSEIKFISSIQFSNFSSLYHFEPIQDFIVTHKTNSLILCTSKDISIYNLSSAHNNNDQIKISYNLFKKTSVDNTLHLSSSILEDIIISINIHFIIKIFDMKLNNIKSFDIDKSFLPKNIDLLPLDVFMLNYDTQTILLSKYRYNVFSFIYNQYNDNNYEYKIKNISINENIICIKEYQKDLEMYYNFKNSSVLLILTEEMSFLILQKVFEDNYDPNDANNNICIPNVRTLLYIDLSSYTKINEYYNLSFSLFNNQHKININNDSINKKLISGIIDIESWNNSLSNINDNMNDFLNYGNKYLKEVEYDYIMLNLAEKIIIFKIDGLKFSNFNNPSLVEHYLTYADKYYKKNFTLLSIIKYFGNNYSVFYVDKLNNIQKFNLEIVSDISMSDNIKNNNNLKHIKNKSKISIDLNKNIKKNNEGINVSKSNDIKENNKVNQKIIIKKKININNNNNSNNSSNNNSDNNLKKIKSSTTIVKNKRKIEQDIDKNNISENFTSKTSALLPKVGNNIRKDIKKLICLKHVSMISLYNNINYAEYNNYNKLTLICQKIDSCTVVSLLDYNYREVKIIVFEKIDVLNIIWIKNTNFIMFNYSKKNIQTKKDMQFLVVFNIHSKILNQKENFVNEFKIKDLFICINMNLFFKLNININKFFIESNLECLNIKNNSKEIKINNNNNNIKTNNNNNNNSNNNNGITNYNTTDNNSKNISKIPNLNNIENSFSFNILLMTSFSLYNLLMKIIKTNEAKEYECEISINFIIKQKSLLLSKYDILNWNKKDFIFNSNEIYYTSYNNNFDFISIIKIDKRLINKKIFESIVLDKISNIHYYNNNYIVYVNKININIYDIKNRAFYRIANEYIFQDDKILLFSYNFHLYLIVLSTKEIKLINLIYTSKNVNDNIITYQFKYKFNFGEFNMINLINNSLFVNESQIIANLNDIINNKNSKNNNKSIQLMKLLLSNTCSIFGKETILDNFLNDDEKMNKLIYNNIIVKYKNSKIDKNLNLCFQNNKAIPNIFGSIDIIKKMITGETDIPKNNNNNLDNIKFIEGNDTSILKEIYSFFNKNRDLSFLNYLYDLITNEKTKKYDCITKYLMLKHYSNLKNNDFKLSTSDLCWLSIINNQTDILNFIYQGNISNITWEKMKKYNIPLWIKSDTKLKELLVEVSKNKYKEDLLNKYKNNKDKVELNNFTENIALYLYLSGNMNLLYNYYDKEPHNEKIKKFIMRDFSVKKNRKAAHENADSLLNKKKYIYAAFFYLLADDVRSSIDMVYEKMNDINLTICILKLIKNKEEKNYLQYYNINKIYTELFIKFGNLLRDPYLVTFGYIGQEKYDLALEYILQYNNEYNLNQTKDTIESTDEYAAHLDLLKKTFRFSVFDYKMILFAQKLEKIYHIKYEESNKKIKNLLNTDFNEDEWDMDELNKSESYNDDNNIKNKDNNNNIDNNNNNTDIDYKMKYINIDYNNLAFLCLKNSMSFGNIFTPVINIFSKMNRMGLKNVPILLKNNLKNILKGRIILDSIYIRYSYNINKNFIKYANELNNFLEYLLKQGIINNKYELYYMINDSCLLFNLYTNLNILPINIYNKNQKLKIIKSIENYSETLFNNIINDLIPFNCYTINSLLKLDEILSRYNNIFLYLIKFIKGNKTDQFYFITIYLLRIIFGTFIFLIYIYKIFLKYNKICSLFNIIQEINNEYNDLSLIKTEKIIELMVLLNKRITKLLKLVKEKIKSKDKIIIETGLIYYIYLMNFAINKELLTYLKNNNMKSISHINKMKLNSIREINFNYVENFQFLIDLQMKIESNINSFDYYLKTFITKELNSFLAFEIYEELKNIYINKKNINYINEDKDNYKIIKIEKVFDSKERNKFYIKFNKFEKIFRLGEIIITNLPLLSDKFKYEKNDDNYNNQVNISDISLPPSNISNKSIQIVKSIYKTGYEICNYNNDIKIKDFCINNCDITQISISFLEKGNIKLNILDNILNKIDNVKSPLEYDTTNINWEKSYEKSLNKDYNSLFKFILRQNNYDNIIPILYQDIIKPKYEHKYNDKSLFFPYKQLYPPKLFNEIPYNSYLEEISLYNPINRKNKLFLSNFLPSQSDGLTIYSDILESHPQLPVYLSSNSNGVIFLYSFSGISKISKVIDEFYIDKNDSNTNHYINRIKFNLFGDNFMACDTEGNLYNWNFEHNQSRKLPQNIIYNNTENKKNIFCNDMCYLNNTGVIATLSNKNIIFFDLLMPEKKRKINEIFTGGDMILPYSSGQSFIISNNDMPGKISFVDIRKMETIKSIPLYNINNDINKKNNDIKIKIMDMKLSENENYLITYGSDYSIRIWDLTNKYNPLLIESLYPYNTDDQYNENNFRGKIKLSSGYLFVSKNNNIRLLRNNII